MGKSEMGPKWVPWTALGHSSVVQKEYDHEDDVCCSKQYWLRGQSEPPRLETRKYHWLPPCQSKSLSVDLNSVISLPQALLSHLAMIRVGHPDLLHLILQPLIHSSHQSQNIIFKLLCDCVVSMVESFSNSTHDPYITLVAQ